MTLRTPDQIKILDQLARKRALEKTAAIRARAEADALFELRMTEAKKATDDVLATAVFTLGTPLNAVGEAYGSKDRKTLKARIATLTQPASIVPHDERADLTVVQYDDNDKMVMVKLTDFTYPGLGVNLNGQFEFTGMGDFIGFTDTDGHTDDAIYLNPLFADILWGIPAVQERVE